MPISFHYNEEKKTLYGVFKGSLGVNEILDTLSQITHSSDYPADVSAIWDLRELDFASIESEFANILLSIREKFPERGSAKIACVASSDLAFGMSRMYQSLSSGLPQTMMIFRTMEEAEDWLNDN